MAIGNDLGLNWGPAQIGDRQQRLPIHIHIHVRIRIRVHSIVRVSIVTCCNKLKLTKSVRCHLAEMPAAYLPLVSHSHSQSTLLMVPHAACILLQVLWALGFGPVARLA